jgi:hypothetical protein
VADGLDRPYRPGACAIAGIWLVVQGIELRRTGKTLDSAFPEKQPA